MCDPGESEWKAKAWKTKKRHTAVTSQNGCLKTWSESRGKHGIAQDGEDWYDVRLIITPDGTAKEEGKIIYIILYKIQFLKCRQNIINSPRARH